MKDNTPNRPVKTNQPGQSEPTQLPRASSEEALSTDAKERAMRPLPEIGQTDTQPDPDAPEPAREHPATGTASHGSASPRKI